MCICWTLLSRNYIQIQSAASSSIELLLDRKDHIWDLGQWKHYRSSHFLDSGLLIFPWVCGYKMTLQGENTVFHPLQKLTWALFTTSTSNAIAGGIWTGWCEETTSVGQGHERGWCLSPCRGSGLSGKQVSKPPFWFMVQVYGALGAVPDGTTTEDVAP